MRTSTTARRLRQLMEQRGLKQIDILRLVLPHCEAAGIRMNRSDISQYVSGKVEPSREKLALLCRALGVEEPWLMGYDGVPEAPPAQQIASIDTPQDDFTLRISDDSMSPRLLPGDLIFCRRQDDAPGGSLAAVMVHGKTILRRIYHLKQGMQLIAENPAYPPMILDRAADVCILGVALSLRRELQ